MSAFEIAVAIVVASGFVSSVVFVLALCRAASAADTPTERTRRLHETR